MKKTIFVVAVASLVVLVGAGCNYQVDVKGDSASLPVANQTTATLPTQTTEKYVGWNTFTSSAGGYSYVNSPTWNAAVNQYNNKNSLFGVGATSQSGKGGVEVNGFTGTLEAYLNYMEQNAEVKYFARENVTINGIAGIRTNHEGFPASGYSVLLKKGDQVFNIYINSKSADDVKLFDKLVASFVFSSQTATDVSKTQTKADVQ